MLMLGDIVVPNDTRPAHNPLHTVDESQASIVIDGIHCDLRLALQQLVQAKVRLQSKLRDIEASIGEVVAKIRESTQTGPPPQLPFETSPSLAPDHAAEADPSTCLQVFEKDLESDTYNGSDSNTHQLHSTTTKRRLSPHNKASDNSKSTESLQAEANRTGATGRSSRLKKQQTTMLPPTESMSRLTEARNESLLESHLTTSKQLLRCDKQTQTDGLLEADSRRSPEVGRLKKHLQLTPERAKSKLRKIEDLSLFVATDTDKHLCQPLLLRDLAAKTSHKKHSHIIRVSNSKQTPAQRLSLKATASKNRQDRESDCRRDVYSGCVDCPPSGRSQIGSHSRPAPVRLQPAVDWKVFRSPDKPSIRCLSTTPKSPKLRSVDSRSVSPQPPYPRSSRTIDSQQPVKSKQPVGRVARQTGMQATGLTKQRSTRLI